MSGHGWVVVLSDKLTQIRCSLYALASIGKAMTGLITQTPRIPNGSKFTASGVSVCFYTGAQGYHSGLGLNEHWPYHVAGAVFF